MGEEHHDLAQFRVAEFAGRVRGRYLDAEDVVAPSPVSMPMRSRRRSRSERPGRCQMSANRWSAV
ncbi:hypothetical protein BJF79_06975 [Actinomadura sp. CNU-125]|nr:hypothetical protein BJF79_06975 [Actinomadura sp. CNU-125]